jgi:hypothetical protein
MLSLLKHLYCTVGVRPNTVICSEIIVYEPAEEENEQFIASLASSKATSNKTGTWSNIKDASLTLSNCSSI